MLSRAFNRLERLQSSPAWYEPRPIGEKTILRRDLSLRCSVGVSMAVIFRQDSHRVYVLARESVLIEKQGNDILPNWPPQLLIRH